MSGGAGLAYGHGSGFGHGGGASGGRQVGGVAQHVPTAARP